MHKILTLVGMGQKHFLVVDLQENPNSKILAAKKRGALILYK